MLLNGAAYNKHNEEDTEIPLNYDAQLCCKLFSKQSLMMVALGQSCGSQGLLVALNSKVILGT